MYFPYAEVKLRPKKCKQVNSCIVAPLSNSKNNRTAPQTLTPCGRGWKRIAFLNMSDQAQLCPSPWTEFSSENKRVCFKSPSSRRNCDSVTFRNTRGEYSQVCGRITGYQKGIAFGFHESSSRSIDTYYINGISITHGQSPRKHIWSFVVGWSEVDDLGSCPCASPTRQSPIPHYVGNNYFCETGTSVNENNNLFFSNDTLWDGQGCSSARSSCECTLNSPPWFTAQLSNSTADDIEIRSCVYYTTAESNIGIEMIELYVK